MNLVLFLLALAMLLASPTTLQVEAQGTERRRTGNVCTEDLNCPDNAFCRQSSYCVCKEGYIYVAVSDSEKACLKVGRNGDPCTKHIQCQTMMGLHSECAAGNCTCKPDTKFVDERCYQTSVVGERCIVDNNCFLADAADDPSRQAYCVRGQCTCMIQYSPRDNGTRCVQDAKLGQTCEDHDQCAGEGLECRNTCLCKDGYAAHDFLNICVKTATCLGDPCEYDVQCQHLSGIVGAREVALCFEKKCSCAPHARLAGNPERCWVKRLPGQPCQQDEECISEEGEPGYCLQGKCTCKSCYPDERDFTGGATVAAAFPFAAMLLTAAILA